MKLPSMDEIKKHFLFGVLDKAALEALLQQTEVQTFGRHEVLFEAGDPASTVMLVLDGAIKSTINALNQREVILELLGPGDLVGEEAVRADRRRSGAIGLRDGRVLLVPAVCLLPLWTQNGKFAERWITHALDSRQRLKDRIAELAYGNIEERLLRMLMRLGRQHGAVGAKGNTVLRFPLTHQELANLIGATRETTTLAMGRLRSSGHIDFLERRIVLLRADEAESQEVENDG